MKILLFLYLVAFSNFTLCQNDEKGIRDTTFIKFLPHVGEPKWKFSYVCVNATKQALGSAAYFYTEPEMSLKAEGKIGIKNQKVGKWMYFYENGSLLGIAYFSKDGNKIGKWKYYKSNGELEKIIIIKNDKFGIQKTGLKTQIVLKEIKEPLELKPIE